MIIRNHHPTAGDAGGRKHVTANRNSNSQSCSESGKLSWTIVESADHSNCQPVCVRTGALLIIMTTKSIKVSVVNSKKESRYV